MIFRNIFSKYVIYKFPGEFYPQWIWLVPMNKMHEYRGNASGTSRYYEARIGRY